MNTALGDQALEKFQVCRFRGGNLVGVEDGLNRGEIFHPMLQIETLRTTGTSRTRDQLPSRRRHIVGLELVDVAHAKLTELLAQAVHVDAERAGAEALAVPG